MTRRWNALYRNLFRKERVDQELEEELRSYIEMIVEDGAHHGTDIDHARREALIEIGNLEQLKENVRDV